MTRENRHKLYKEVLRRFVAFDKSSIEQPGVCYFLSLVSGDDSWEAQENILKKFPEFAKKKPKLKDESEHWWPFNRIGYNKRIEAIKECIKETRPSKSPSSKTSLVK